MRTRTLFSLAPLAAALSVAAASSAGAQPNDVVVCRDGSQRPSNSARACDGRGGVDAQATEAVRRYRADRRRDRRDGRRDDRWDDRRDRRDDRRDDRWDDRRNRRDDRDSGYGRGGYDRGGYAGAGQLFQWTGRVDREVRLELRDRRLSVQRGDRGEGPFYPGRVARELPRTAGSITVRLLDGRGDVDVIQQPGAYNDYTAVVRLRDPSGGADTYRIAAYWQPAYTASRR